MIAALRRRHRRITLALALAAPLVVLGALLARVSAPVTARLPTALGPLSPPPAPAPLLSEHRDSWGSLPIVTRWLGERAGEPSAVELRPERALRAPELLVYWMPPTSPPEAFPADARLLGRLAGTYVRRFALPEPRGSLVLYSLGHREQLGSTGLPSAEYRQRETPLPARGTD